MIETGIIAAVIAAIGGLAAYLFGVSKGRDKERYKKLRDDAKAGRRMDEADIGIGATDSANRDWLRARGDK